MTNATLGASGLWVGTRTGASDISTLTYRFFFLPHPMTPWTIAAFSYRSKNPVLCSVGIYPRPHIGTKAQMAVLPNLKVRRVLGPPPKMAQYSTGQGQNTWIISSYILLWRMVVVSMSFTLWKRKKYFFLKPGIYINHSVRYHSFTLKLLLVAQPLLEMFLGSMTHLNEYLEIFTFASVPDISMYTGQKNSCVLLSSRISKKLKQSKL